MLPRLLMLLIFRLVDCQYNSLTAYEYGQSHRDTTGLRSLETGFTLSTVLSLGFNLKQIVWVVPELSDDWSMSAACASGNPTTVGHYTVALLGPIYYYFYSPFGPIKLF